MDYGLPATYLIFKQGRQCTCNVILGCVYDTKSVQSESSCSVRTDRQTDITKLIVAFRTFANAPENPAGISVVETFGRTDSISPISNSL